MPSDSGTSGSDPRIIVLEGGVNIRDLGGYAGVDGRRVRWRQVFRSGTTHFFTSASRERLVEMGIRVAVDLRSRQEQKEQPHGFGAIPELVIVACDHDRVTGNLIQLLHESRPDATHVRDEMLELYRELPYGFRGVYQLLFHRVARGPLPLVFNCAAGKDRTGVAAALLLNALGVDWADIEADYLLTERFVPQIMHAVLSSRMGRRLAQMDPAVLVSLFGVDRAYLQAMRDSVTARSGSFECYFRSELQLGPELLEELRERLLPR